MHFFRNPPNPGLRQTLFLFSNYSLMLCLCGVYLGTNSHTIKRKQMHACTETALSWKLCSPSLALSWVSSETCVSFAALTFGSRHNFKTSSLLIRSEKSDGAIGGQQGRNWEIKINGTPGIEGERHSENERVFWLMWAKWQALGHECENLMGLASEVGLSSKMKSLWSWLLWWMKRCARRSLTDSGKTLEPSPVPIKK